MFTIATHSHDLSFAFNFGRHGREQHAPEQRGAVRAPGTVVPQKLVIFFENLSKEIILSEA